MDVSDQCSVKQRLCFYPEIISGFAVAFGVGDQNGYQLQNILFAVNVSEGIVMHTLLEVDGIQDLQSVSEVEQHLTAFGYDTALGIRHDKTDRILFRCALHQVRFEPEPGFTGATATNNQHVFITRCSGVSGTVVHGQALRLGEYDVILKLRVHIRSDILSGSPSGRAIFQILAKLLSVFAFHIYCQPDSQCDGNTHTEVNRMEARYDRCKSSHRAFHEVHNLTGQVRSRCQAYCLAQLGAKQSDKHIGDIRQDELFPVYLLQRSSSFFFVRSTTAALIRALNLASFSRMEGRSFFLTTFAVYS